MAGGRNAKRPPALEPRQRTNTFRIQNFQRGSPQIFDENPRIPDARSAARNSFNGPDRPVAGENGTSL